MGSLNIIPTKFVNLHDPKDVEYGFRWWNDDNSDFDHTADWIIPLDLLQFLAFVLEQHTKDIFTDSMEWMYSNKCSLAIARQYVDWDQWGPVYERHLAAQGFDPPDIDPNAR